MRQCGRDPRVDSLHTHVLPTPSNDLCIDCTHRGEITLKYLRQTGAKRFNPDFAHPENCVIGKPAPVAARTLFIPKQNVIVPISSGLFNLKFDFLRLRRTLENSVVLRLHYFSSTKYNVAFLNAEIISQ